MQIQNNTDQLHSRRKSPRVSLVFDSRFLRPLSGVKVLWEDRSQSHVFDMSLTGIVLEKTGVLKEILVKAKPGSLFSIKLKFEAQDLGGLPEERLSLDLRVVELGTGYVSAMIDSIASEGRMKLTQNLKDAFVVKNFNLQSSPEEMLRLHPDFSGLQWYHSAFDTNVLLRLEQGELKDLLIEYDTLFLKYNADKGVQIQKSFAMADLGHGYSQLWLQQQNQKVAMGASWPERLSRILEQAGQASPKMAADFQHVRNFMTALRDV